ncbi:MAG: DUF1822 family protein [Coleofasciculus sp. Co-bin14]|nr:DUF1822 family protein [Coleofasciculus sp. Co-bin14]
MNTTQTPLLTVPLGGEAHAFARQFATQQATPQKGKRVYLNTLAVYAVHNYLKWLQIETDLNQSDSWQPALQAVFDAADLVIPSIGKLECRPVLPGETTFLVPPKGTEDRIGCVAVQLSERLDEVQLLGFVPTIAASDLPEQLVIANLQPLDTLLDYIPEVAVPTANQVSVNLSRWFENTFEAGWQTLEALFSSQALNPAFSVRNAEQSIELDVDNPEASVSGGKLIDLGMQLAGHRVALTVTLKAAESDREMDVRLRVYPTGSQIYLPAGLKLLVLDDSGAAVPDLEATARTADNWIQLEFSGQLQEQFSVKVALGDVSITEHFVI